MEGEMDFKAKTTSSLKNMSRMFGEFFKEVGSTMSAVETDLVNLYSDFVDGVIPLFHSHPNSEWHEDLPSELLSDDESLIDKLEDSSFSAEGVAYVSLVDARCDSESLKSDNFLSVVSKYGNSEEGDRSDSEHEEDDDKSKADAEGEVDSIEKVEGEFSSEGEDDEDSNEREVEGEREYSNEEDEYSSDDEDEYSSDEEDEDSSDDEDSGEEEDEDSSQEGESSSEEEDCSEQAEEDDYSSEDIDDDISCVTDSLVDASSDGESVKFDALSSNANYGQSDDNSEGEEYEDDCASDQDIEEMEKAIIEMIKDACASDIDIEKWKKAFEERLEDVRASDLDIEELIKEFQWELNECSNDWETMETTLENQFQTAQVPFYDFFSGYIGCTEGLMFPYEATAIDELFIYMPLEQRCDTNIVPHTTNDELEVKFPLQENNLSPEITPKSNKEEDANQCPSPKSVIKVKGFEDLISCISDSSVAVHFDGESMRSGYGYPDADYGRSDDDSSEGDAEDDCVAEETFENELDEELVSKVAPYQEYESLAPVDQEEVRLSDYHGFSDSEWDMLTEVDYNEVRKSGKLKIADSDWEIV